VKWFIKHFPIAEESFIPVVGETDDSWLNDMYGFHIRPEHVFQAIENAKSGPVEEGNVGGGTSNVTFHFKGGMGTSSRKVAGGYMLGVLVQSNFGRRQDFRIAGIPIGKKITDLEIIENPFPKMYPAPKKKAEKSIVVTLATDAPMLPHQLRRIAERVGLGMSRVGSIGRDSSGEFFVAFSTVQPKNNKKNTQTWEGVTLDKMDDFFEAAVDATEEAILNALVAAETMEGVNGNKVFAVPWDRVLPLLKQHNLLQSRKS
jgi:L-aminopeptidase/D-esterase-like protein